MFESKLTFDECLKRVEQLARYADTHLATRNEATTRLHLVDTLLFDCLGWQKKDVVAEEFQQRQDRREFTDYTFFAPRRIMILEAKREGEYFSLPLSKISLTYELKSLCRGNDALTNALHQVAGYCQSRGVPLGTICNGHQLVAFVANRSDGVPPLDGRALVFPTMWHMCEHFVDLWNALSYEGVEDKNLFHRLIGKSGPSLIPPLSASLAVYPGTKRRNVLQAELKSVADMVIEDMPESDELEDDFLRKCYCTSGALSQHSMASKAILRARYESLTEADEVASPSVVSITHKGRVTPELYAESMSRRPILLLGSVGVGKSTFIRHFMKVDAIDLLRNAISLRIDLGSQAALSVDLREYVVDEIGRQLLALYNVDIEAAAFVRGVYHADLNRFRKSIYGELAKTDPSKFQEQELRKLEQLLSDRSRHCMNSLEHLSKARKNQVVLFIDNADQRGDATQDEAFLIAQEIAAQWPVLVYIPLRPETFYRSAKRGALTGYHPKAFTISPPRIDRVLHKRLSYAISLAELILEDGTAPSGKEEITKLKIVIRSFLSSLDRNELLIESIDNIAGSNVRLALQLVREFFGSGHVDTANIVEKGAGYVVSVHEFLRAVIYGDCEYFSPSLSPIANVFDICSRDGREHFLLLVVLSLLREANNSDAGFVETCDLYNTLQGMGFRAEQIDFAIVRATRKHLIEAPMAELDESHNPASRKMRITTIGLYHLNRLSAMFFYLDATVVATSILDDSTRARIGDAKSIQDRLDRAAIFKTYLDIEWESAKLTCPQFDWAAISDALNKDIHTIQKRQPPRTRPPGR